VLPNPLATLDAADATFEAKDPTDNVIDDNVLVALLIALEAEFIVLVTPDDAAVIGVNIDDDTLFVIVVIGDNIDDDADVKFVIGVKTDCWHQINY